MKKKSGLLMGCLGFAAHILNAQNPQPPAPRPPKNYIQNGGFEQVETWKNLYDGVDAHGDIRVQEGTSPVFLEGGELDSTFEFACSPYFADVNGDGLPDLVVAAPDGHLYWYPNIGKKGEPVFDHGRLIQTYLGPASRICVCDWNGDGKPDLLFGNVDGEANLMLNMGGGKEGPRWIHEMGKPRWFHPSGYPKQKNYELDTVKIGKDPITVGVYSAPCFADWNKDGRPDLIMGEGGYSSNSIHIWLNSGTKTSPRFNSDSHFLLAFGEGREQLTPTVYDWNGDGIPDLIVGDRDGRLALYLGTEASIKDPKKIEPVEFTKFIAVGGREKLGSLISPQVCDYNGDGIPDIIYGNPRGLVNVALGKGNRKDPELDAPFPIKGMDVARDFKTPSGWLTSGGQTSPTFSGLPAAVSVEDDPKAEIKEGKRAFHISFFEKFAAWTYITWNEWPNIPGAPSGWEKGGFSMWSSILPFIMGKDYEISFISKGNRMRLFYDIHYSEELSKVPKGPPTRHIHTYGDEVNMGSSWRQTRKTYRMSGTRWLHHDTNGQKNSVGTLQFLFLGEGDGWLDDIKLNETEKK